MRRRDFLKLAAVGVGASVGGIAYANQSRGIEITTKELFVPGLLNPLRIVAISDVHAPSYFRHNDYLDLINLINNHEPDIFILAGDTIDDGGEEKLVSVFSLVKARIAKLAIVGNWEYNVSLNLRKLRNEYEKTGTNLLVNQKVSFEGLSIVGLDDFLCGSPDYRLLNDKSTDPLLVMSHCPESFDFMPLVGEKPLIVISGHTHGGQIAPFGVVLMKPKGCGVYEKGWYRRGNHSMYVMRGIGTSGIPVRIGSPPEVLVLNLRSNNSAH